MFSCSVVRLLLLSLGFVILAAPSRIIANPVQQIDLVPIYTIQGKGAATTMAGRWVDAYGVVTGVTATGFYLQDPMGDSDPTTSDGIFVYTYDRPAVQHGACVLVTRAFVSEFYEKTELSRIKAVTATDRCATTMITPVELPVLRWGSDPAAHYEPFEGMLVAVRDLAGVVHGPTRRYVSGEVEISLLPSPLAPYVEGGRIFHTDADAGAHLIYLSNPLGALLPEANWGDHIAVGQRTGEGNVVQAVLDYNFGKYQLLLLPEAEVRVERQSHGAESGVANTMEDFTVCTVNLHGLGRGAAQFPNDVLYQANLRQRALAISERLQGCTIIGLQEIGSPQDGESLAAELRTTFDLAYEVVAFPSPQTSNLEFPLTNGLLMRTERVHVLAAAAPQGCSDQDYEVADPVNHCPAGYFPLFDRLPLVVDLSIAGDWGEPVTLRVVNNHWKSKAGDESINLGQRDRQARFVASLVQEATTDNGLAHVIVLGDLNDFYNSGPVETVQAGVQPPLIQTYDFLPAVDRYTYIFNGNSQVLDHILVTPGLLPMLARIEIIHINADFAQPVQVDFTNALRTSDHDPVQILLRPGGAAMIGGNVSFPGVEVLVVDATGKTVASTHSDALGDFRFWNLRSGSVSLRLNAPDYVSYPLQDMTLPVQTGYNRAGILAPVHQSAELGIALALLSPYLAAPAQ